MAQSDIIYKGEDKEITIDLDTLVFANLVDFIVGFKIEKQLVKVARKTGTGLNEIVAIAGEPNKCLCRIYASETVNWPCGILYLELKSVEDNVNFPNDVHLEGVVLAATIEDIKIASL